MGTFRSTSIRQQANSHSDYKMSPISPVSTQTLCPTESSGRLDITGTTLTCRLSKPIPRKRSSMLTRSMNNMWLNIIIQFQPPQPSLSLPELPDHHERQMPIDGISEWVIWAKKRWKD